MIVTRHRKRRSSAGRLILPLFVLAALAFVLAWPPAQRIVANGPLKPVWTVAATTGGVVSRPFTFAAQQQTITERNRRIQDLDAQLEQQRKAKADAESRVQQLRQQMTAQASQPQTAPVPAPRRAPATDTLAAAIPPGGAQASQPATDDEKRLAATWAAMEPEKAAAIVQKMPDDAVTRVLSSMDADSAGAIMNALPATVAARISRAVAQVPPAANR